MPYWPRARYLELAPAYWAQTRARLDPVELQAELGFVTVPSVLVGHSRAVVVELKSRVPSHSDYRVARPSLHERARRSGYSRLT